MSIDDISKQDDTQQQTEQELKELEDRFAAFDAVNPPRTPKKKKRMRANTRSLIIAVAIAAALALVLVMLTIFLPSADDDTTSDPVSDTTSEEAPTYVLFDKTNVNAKTAVVQKVAFDNQGGKYTIVYDDEKEEYFIKGYEDLSLSQNADDLISACISLTADNKVTSPSTLDAYGLDDPASSVTITYYDGTETTINIGNLVATQDGYYLNQSGSEDVYMVVTDTANLFLASDWWFVSTTLFTPPSAREDDEEGSVLLKEVTISGKNHTVPLTIRRPMPEDGEEYSYYKYVTVKPYLRGINDSVGDALYAFSSMYAERAAILHPTAKQLNDLGFNDPYSVIEFTQAVEIQGEVEDAQNDVTPKSYYNNVKHRLTVGCRDADGYYVVMIDDINAIFLVSADSIELMAERQFTNTITSLLFLKKIESMGQITLRVDNDVYDFNLTHYPDKEDSSDKLKVKMDGKSYDTANFRSLYVLMMDLERYGRIDSCPTTKADISLELRLTDGSLYLGVDFYRQSGSLYMARTSDGEIFSITASSVNTLLEQVDNYLNNETVVG